MKELGFFVVSGHQGFSSHEPYKMAVFTLYSHSLLSSSGPLHWVIMTITQLSGLLKLCREGLEKDFKGSSEMGLSEILQSLTASSICGCFSQISELAPYFNLGSTQ